MTLMFVYLYIRSIIELIENVKKKESRDECDIPYRYTMNICICMYINEITFEMKSESASPLDDSLSTGE